MTPNGGYWISKPVRADSTGAGVRRVLSEKKKDETPVKET